MSQIKSVLDLCENLANVNLRICNQIKNGGLNEEILYEYFENTALLLKSSKNIVKILSRVMEYQMSQTVRKKMMNGRRWKMKMTN